MNTLNEAVTHSSKAAKSKPVLLSKIIALFRAQANHFENSRFALMTLFLTIQSCVGSVAFMFILQNGANTTMLATCAAITMACNSVLIAQCEAKWCLGLFYLSLATNATFILFNI